MIDLSRIKTISETYEVEKTVEVVMEVGARTETFRIDALRFVRDGRVRYTTRVSVLASTELDNGGNANISSQVWRGYSAPWTDADDADQAIVHQLALMQP